MTIAGDQLGILNSTNASYVAHLYAQYLKNPHSVDSSWSAFFSDLNDDSASVLAELGGASWGEPEAPLQDPDADSLSSNGSAAGRDWIERRGLSGQQLRSATLDSIQALMMIRAYRVRGHLQADLDPLGLQEKKYHPELDPASYGFGERDYDRPIFINYVLGLESATLRQIVDILQETYCGTIGVEFMHIQDPDQKSWIQQRIEAVHNRTDFTTNGKRAILQRLTAAESFEQFLHKKYVGTKRFGIDGGEALIPAIEQIMKRGGQIGLKEIVLGMPHRGRLNVLTNVMGKSFTAVFSEFQGGSSNPEEVEGSGDVKYHLGTSSDRDFDGNVIHLSLTANPSHLEAVNPVVLGKVRAKQEQRKDDERDQVMPLLLHGDAAFAGQGLVAETLMLSELKGYKVGGCIHIIVNNQIGFTTLPQFSRSGPYSTDVAGMIQAPIFHVNGDDPEAVVHVARIAMEFRQKFKKDVVIDMFCYRRFGHNEGDEPMFTQPLMYKKIKTQPSTRALYAERLVLEGVLTEAEAKALVDDFHQYLEDEFTAAEGYAPDKADMLEGEWSGIQAAAGDARRGNTAVSEALLQKVGSALTTVPAGLNVHKKILRQLEDKKKMFESGEGVDWATAELLAFGTLLAEGYPVRFTGQDCIRGTFSQRHSAWIDQETGERYFPLNNIDKNQAEYFVHDSPLSEFAVLGYEYGYSLAEPNALTLWEAQFGDFANGAQVIFDQFISSGESKWLRMSGLVMLLPHGYEGQGPEHSSARPERFLQLCGEDNWQVVNCTTPANYFHALRRQIHRNFRKPLVVFTPKSLLRHKRAVSPVSMFVGEQTFHRVLYEDNKPGADQAIKRVVLCTGKVFYDIEDERDKREIKDITIYRLEQLYPWPEEALKEEMARYPNADFVWCQEEPRNMGGWRFLDRRLERVLTELRGTTTRPIYAGRAEAASPATGLNRIHLQEQAKLVDEALNLDYKGTYK